MRYIDADNLIKQIEHDSKGKHGQYGDEWQFMNTICNQPTADVRENVRGKWWHEPNNNNTWIQRCSNCFHVAMITAEEECPYNYCPICGADMRGGKE